MERKVAMGVLLALALVTSGCVQAVTSDTIAFEASPASVGTQAVSDNGYELNERESVEVNRTVELPVLGQRDVSITNHFRAYSRADAQGENAEENAAGAFIVVSTPQAQVLGQPTNPLGRVPLRELVSRIGGRYSSFGDLEEVGSQNVTALGKSTRVRKFSTTVQMQGQSVETFVYVTRIQHKGDYVITVGVLPKVFSDEEEGMYELIRNLNHQSGG